ncbi:hypothetical protein DV735_g2833, partial [Chaetothyriales sp. CBS 134920]
MPPLSTEEDIAWLKSTFHPIPKVALPDDSIEYAIYLLSETTDQGNDSETRLKLRDVQKYVAELQKQWLKGYIWQRQPFSLELRKDDGVSYLYGCVEYGDSIEDEWVIVWLLREITKKFSAAWVKVTDNDGEFLLIEASGALPWWLEPDVAENRVWINDGQLKIIRPEGKKKSANKAGEKMVNKTGEKMVNKAGEKMVNKTGEKMVNKTGEKMVNKTGEKLSMADARRIILTDRKRLMHSISIEEEAFFRLRNYPGQIKDNVHNALVTIPRKIAYLLKQKPAYISPAIEAFYLRDPISMKALSSSKHLDKMVFPPKDFVTVSAKFPKVAYAQMKSQEFPVPRVFEPSPSPLSDVDANSSYLSGLKLICGFEMLLTDKQYQDRPAVREMKMLLEDLDTENEELPTDAEIATWERVQDDEKWLEIDFNDLQNELDGRTGAGSGAKSQDFADKAAQENLRKIVKQFEDFLNDDQAGPGGADVFGDDSDDDLDEDDSVDGEDGEDGEVEFTKLMQELMGMPPEVMEEIMKGELGPGARSRTAEDLPIRPKKQGPSRVEVEEPDSDSSADEEKDEDLETIMQTMEKELKEKGALNLDPIVNKTNALRRSVKGKASDNHDDNDDNDDNDSTDDHDDSGDDSNYNDIDANLVQNLLESFKAQAGAAGPMGNLMGLMGVNMPRDAGNSSVSGAAEGFAKGVTGGGSATAVYPTTNAELVSYLGDSSARVIILTKTFDFTSAEGTTTGTGCAPWGTASACQVAINKNGWCTNYEPDAPTVSVTYNNAAMSGIKVASNKSLVGEGSAGVIKGKGLKIVSGASNIIIQNVHITDLNPKYVWGGDAITLDDTDLVWIDHVKTSLIGRQHIVLGTSASGRVTISNNEIDGESTYSATCDGHHYWALYFTGSSDLVTLKGNYVHHTSGRSPKVAGNTLLHAVNNYWYDNSGHAFEVGSGANIVVEGDVFKNVVEVVDTSSDAGKLFTSEDATTNAACSSYLGHTCQVNVYTNSTSYVSSDESFFSSFSGKNVASAGAASGVASSVVSNAGIGKL